MTTENKTVVVVGAGMAGLTASAYLAREGYRVLLLDKNDRVGGLVNTFDRDGFSFDAGPRAFVNSGIVKPILKDLGISLDTVDNRVSIGIEDQLVYVESMDSVGDYERHAAGPVSQQRPGHHEDRLNDHQAVCLHRSSVRI